MREGGATTGLLQDDEQPKEHVEFEKVALQ